MKYLAKISPDNCEFIQVYSSEFLPLDGGGSVGAE